MGTAFYASFLPSRASNRVHGAVDPAAGLTFSGAVVAQPRPAQLAFTVETQSRTVTAASSAAGILPSIANIPPTDDPNLRITIAATTPEAGGFPQLAPGATATPTNATATPPVSGTPRPGVTGTPTPGSGTPSSGTATPSPTPTRTPLPAGAKPPCDTTQSDLFCVYEVQSGDTLSTIAEKFGIKGNDDVEPWSLLVHSNKPDIVDEDDLLQIGQKIRIPNGGVPLPAPARPTPQASSGTPTTNTATAPGTTPTPAASTARAGGVIHTVLSTQTLIEIGEQYGVEAADILAANVSRMSDPNKLSIGQELLIPNPKRFAPAAVAAAPAPTPAAGGAAGSAAAASVPVGPRSNVGFMWPVSGPISSYFGPRHPQGIDIDLYANGNAAIAAVAAGTVTFAGGNTCCSYGLYVTVDHGNGFTTLYAHLSKINVSVGQKVNQGAVLGNGGRTGYATGNHLHFEVHRNGATVNPMSFLP